MLLLLPGVFPEEVFPEEVFPEEEFPDEEFPDGVFPCDFLVCGLAVLSPLTNLSIVSSWVTVTTALSLVGFFSRSRNVWACVPQMLCTVNMAITAVLFIFIL